MEELRLLVTSGLSRRGLFKGGLIVGLGAAGISVTSTAVTRDVARASQNELITVIADYPGAANTTEVQTQWSYCGQCRNLYYAGENISSCAWSNYNAGGDPHGTHAAGSSTNYGVMIDNPGFYVNENPPSGNAYLQSPWRWCNLCGCLFWGNGQAGSWCPHAGYDPGQINHSSSGSGVYYMPSGMDGNNDAWNASGATVQPGWRYCANCKCLYWGGAWSASWCQYQIARSFLGGISSFQHATGNTVYTVFMM